MNYFYRLGQSPVRLFILAQISILVAFAWKDFPVFIFFAFAPIFALIDNPSGLKDFYLAFLVAIVTALIFAYTMEQERILSWIIYFTLLAGIFGLYIFMQILTDDRLNKFALVIFILGMEYLLLKFTINNDPVFLADLLAQKTSWTRWNIFAGYTGTSLWILLSNLLLYTALFKNKKINWTLVAVFMLVVTVPIVYSSTLAYNALTKGEVISFYVEQKGYNSNYMEHGELISRTGAWVSVLIIIFTLVKGRTKKVLR